MGLLENRTHAFLAKPPREAWVCECTGHVGCGVTITDGQLKQLNRKNSAWKRGVVHGPTPPFGMPGAGLRAQPGTCQEVQTRAIQGMHLQAQ